MHSTDAFDTLAHQLLDELEVRHDQLLADLDELSLRVDAVLGQYVQLRPDAASSSTLDRDSDDDFSSELESDLAGDGDS